MPRIKFKPHKKRPGRIALVFFISAKSPNSQLNFCDIKKLINFLFFFQVQFFLGGARNGKTRPNRKL